MYKSSMSSSSRTIGVNIASGIKLNASIIPLTNCEPTIKKVKKPNKDQISWKDTLKTAK
jgi:hypothetical protein